MGWHDFSLIGAELEVFYCKLKPMVASKAKKPLGKFNILDLERKLKKSNEICVLELQNSNDG